MVIQVAELLDIIGRARCDLTHEKSCQAQLETHLAACLPLGCSLQREYRLSAYEVPDFLVDGRIVVEVKLNNAQPRAVLRQLGRYALFREVEGLILASNKAVALPRLIEGKPAHFVSLGRAWL